MRFILGAMSAVVVLMLGAVAFTVLNPLDPAAPTASVAPEVVPAEETVTRAEASLLDHSGPEATDEAAIASEMTAPPAPLPEPETQVVAAAALVPAPLADVVTAPEVVPTTSEETPDVADMGPVLISPKASPSTAALVLETDADKPVLRPVAWLSPVAEVSPLPPVADTTPAPQADMVFVTGNRVNMRTGPGSRYKWLATLSRGTGLVLIEKSNRWYKVQTKVDGQVVTGWMASGFLSSVPVEVQAALTDG